MRMLDRITERIASESIVSDEEKKSELWKEFEKWYYSEINTLFSNVNSELSSFNLPFDYSVEYDQQFETCREDMDDDGVGGAIGIALFSNQVDVHVLPVAMDPEKIYDTFADTSIGFIYKHDARKEMLITLWHEVGHGLLQAFVDEFECDIMEEQGWTDEEEIAEEFGQAKGDLNGSRLGKWIKARKDDNWSNFIG